MNQPTSPKHICADLAACNLSARKCAATEITKTVIDVNVWMDSRSSFDSKNNSR